MSKLFMDADFPPGISTNAQIDDTPTIVAERYYRNLSESTDPDLLLTLDDIFPMKLKDSISCKPSPTFDTQFDYVESPLTEGSFESVERFIRGIFNGVGSPQLMELPLIKGPSGSGKTRLGVELVKCGMACVKKSNKTSLSTFISMSNRLYIDSTYFARVNRSGQVSVDPLGYISAILLFVLLKIEDIPPLETIVCLMKGYVGYRVEQLSMRLRELLDVDMLFLHLDEYRDDLAGTNALFQYCAKTFYWGREEACLKIFPIITGMTSYVSPGDSMAMFTGRFLNIPTNNIPNVVVTLLHGLRKYPDAVSQLEKQYLQILIYAAHRRDASQTELDTVNDRIRIQEWPNLRPFLNDIDGHPRFYEFALKLSRQERLTLLDTTMRPEDMQIIRTTVLRTVSTYFSLDTWKSQVSFFMRVHPDITGQPNGYDIVLKEATEISMRMLLHLAITETKISPNWSFGDINTSLGVVHLNSLTIMLGVNSGLYQITDYTHDPIKVEMPPLLISALNEIVGAVDGSTLTCIPRTYPAVECVEGLRSQLVVKYFKLRDRRVESTFLHMIRRQHYRGSEIPQNVRNSDYPMIPISTEGCFEKRVLLFQSEDSDFFYDVEMEDLGLDLSDLPFFAVNQTSDEPSIDGMSLFSNKNTRMGGIETMTPNDLLMVITVVLRESDTTRILVDRISHFFDSVLVKQIDAKHSEWKYVIDIIRVEMRGYIGRLDDVGVIPERMNNVRPGCLGVCSVSSDPMDGAFPPAYRPFD